MVKRKFSGVFFLIEVLYFMEQFIKNGSFLTRILLFEEKIHFIKR